jgi:hypothetical protein
MAETTKENEMTVRYYHGTNDVERIMQCLVGDGMINTNFHLTPDLSVASELRQQRG